MSINSRIATTNDLKVIFELSREFASFNSDLSGDKDEFFYNDWEKGFMEEIKNALKDKNTVTYIAEDTTDGVVDPVGFIVGRYCPDCYHFVIDELYIKDKYRGTGIGKTLMANVIEIGRNFNCPIRVEVYNWNTKAIEFYKRLGFTPDSTILEIKPTRSKK